MEEEEEQEQQQQQCEQGWQRRRITTTTTSHATFPNHGQLDMVVMDMVDIFLAQFGLVKNRR